MLVSDRVDDTVDDLHLGKAELSPNDVQKEISPGISHLFFKIILNWECDHPLSTGTVSGVLPFRLDMLLENEVVRVGNYLRSLVGVVVHAPEILESIERKYLVEYVFVMAHSFHLFLLSMRESVDIPECPCKLKIMLLADVVLLHLHHGLFFGFLVYLFFFFKLHIFNYNIFDVWFCYFLLLR